MKWIYRHTEPSLWTVGFYAPDGSFEPESDCGSPDEAAAQVHWLNGGCDSSVQNASCPTAATTLQAVLHQAEHDEQCPACDYVNEWDPNRSSCPYHHGYMEGHERACGDFSQVAIAFQVDPELIGTVLDARSQQKIHEFELLQRAEGQQPAPEGLSEHEKQVRDAVHELDPRDR